MNDQLWTLLGVTVGIVGTGGLGWIRDAASSKRADTISRRQENRILCVELLEEAESRETRTLSFEEQYGALPGQMGHDRAPAPLHSILTRVELQCPPAVHGAAKNMVEALDGWAYDYGRYEKWRAGRDAFVEAVRAKL